MTSRTTIRRGYVVVADPSGRRWPSGELAEKRVQRLVVENALGHLLPPKAVVHHIDGNRTNNDPSNLVACQDSRYHNLLHQRQRALNACGHPDWLRCLHCHRWDAPTNLVVSSSPTKSPWHWECGRRYEQARKARSAPEHYPSRQGWRRISRGVYEHENLGRIERIHGLRWVAYPKDAAKPVIDGSPTMRLAMVACQKGGGGREVKRYLKQHTTSKPCLACRRLVKGNELDADRLWHPECGHFHEPGQCPEVRQ